MGNKKANTNIDNRSVLNLETFFEKKKKTAVTNNAEYYKTGAIVTWIINNKCPIGIVTNSLSKDRKRSLIVHNVGAGNVLKGC